MAFYSKIAKETTFKIQVYTLYTQAQPYDGTNIFENDNVFAIKYQTI